MQIKRRDGTVLWEGEAKSIKEAVEKAVGCEADLSGADLGWADLRGADLRGAYLSGADLCEADLSEADLSEADLREIKRDFYDVLNAAKVEVPGLLKALQEGRVSGSTYEGPCACLVGTIANLRGCKYTEIPDITPNADRPAERWFLAIREGDTPANSQVSAITVQWIREWMRWEGIHA